MKQNYLKSLFLMLMMCVGMGAWAEDVTGTIKFGTNDVKINAASVTGDDDQENTWTITTAGTTSFTTNASYYQVGSSSKPATSITFTTTLAESATIKSMSAKFGGFSGTAGTVTLKVGNTTVGTGSLNATNDVTVNSTSTATGTVLTVTVTGIAKGVKVYDISYTYESGNEQDSDKELIAIQANGTPAEFWKGDAFNHNGVTVTALWDDENETDVTSSCTFTGYDMSTPGEQTVTVTYQGETCEYGIEVKTIANTQADAYTVAQAKALIDADKDLATEVYVKGTVSQIDSYNSTYGSITYWLSEDGTTTNQFEVYGGLAMGNDAQFSAKEDLTVGDDVIVYGIIKKFNSTYEFDKNNYLVKWDKLATLSIADITVAEGEDITPVITTNVIGEYLIEYTSNNEEVILADGDELVTMGYGNATITATLVADGYKTAETTFNVTVTTNATVTSITLSGELVNNTYTIGDTFDHSGLVATANYSDGTDANVTETATWEVDPETLTTAGTVTVTVSASFGGQEDIQEYEVTVNKKEANISFASTAIEVEVGKTQTLAPTTTPADAEISYTITEGSEFVSIENGVVTGVAEGTATIRADFAGNAEFNEASTTLTVNVNPEVTKVTFDLSKDETTTATTTEMSWVTTEVSMVAEKGEATTNTNNYYPGTSGQNYTSTRFYKNSTLTITPAAGITITSIEYTATTPAYATALSGSTWRNASAAASETLVTITPTDGTKTITTTIGGTTGASSIVIYYTGDATAALNSIAISGTYPTEFNKGDVFSHDGMTVTANYTDGSEADVTSSATFSGYDMSTLGEQTVTVSYTEDEITKTAKYNITITKGSAELTPVTEGYETVDFATLYSSVTNNATIENYEGNSFVMTFAKPQGSNTPTKYYNIGKSVRAYEGNTITIDGAEKIMKVSIAWTKEKGEDKEVTIEGLESKTVVVTFANTCSFSSITVHYGTEISISSAGYATYYTDKAFVMPAGLKGLTVSANDGGNLTLAEKYQAKKVVPANTPLILKGEQNTYTLTYTDETGADAGENYLRGKLTSGMIEAESGDYYYYKLTTGPSNSEYAGKLGFYWGEANGGVFEMKNDNRAYLVLPKSASVKAFTFDDFETAIFNIENYNNEKTVIYDMQGRKVSKAQKGLYIINGRKMVK